MEGSGDKTHPNGIAGLCTLYGKDFFREWGSGNSKYVESARAITGVLNTMFKPARLADIGSGCGAYSFFFRELGVDVASLDGVIPPPEHSFPGPVVIRDFRTPFENIWGHFDLALCLEVVEHIPEGNSEVFLSNLSKFSDLLLMSYAPPHQGGTGHVNEQPKRHWIERLALHGFTYNRRETGVIMETFKKNKTPYMWMTENICVFRRTRTG